MVSVQEIVDLHLEATAAVVRTGELCKTSGAYRCDSCGGETIPVAKGEEFPWCAGERKRVKWILIRAA